MKTIQPLTTDRHLAPDVPLLPVDGRAQLVDSETKQLRMRQNLAHIQSKLGPSSQRFSRFVHHPLVQLLSEAAAKTVARPAGLLGGSIVALLGSALYALLSYHYEYAYNFVVILLLFVAGWLVGLLSEYVLTLLHRLNR